MNLSGLLTLLGDLPPFRRLLAGGSAAPLTLLQAARPFVAAGLQQARGSALVLLTSRSELAQQLTAQLEQWLPPVSAGGPPLLHFAEPDALPFERILWSSATRQQRLTSLAALQSRANGRWLITDGPDTSASSQQPAASSHSAAPPIVIASARALMQKTLPARELRLALRPVKVGEIVRLEQMAERWVQSGYNSASVVEEPGVFARRGGIVDIWPPNLPQPLRIDLFGDEVESLRLFDPATQRTLHQVQSVEIGPGSEALAKYGPAALQRLGLSGDRLLAAANLDATGGGAARAVPAPVPGAAGPGSPLLDPSLLLAVRDELRLEVEQLSQSQSFHGIEWYLPYFYDQPASLLDYLPGDGLLILDDAIDFFATLRELEIQAGGLREELQRSGELPHNFAPNFFTSEELRERLQQLAPLILGYGNLEGKATAAQVAPGHDEHPPLARCFVPGPRYGGKTKQIAADIEKFLAAEDGVVLVSRQAARLQSLLQEQEIVAHVRSDLSAATGVQLSAYALQPESTPQAAPASPHDEAPPQVVSPQSVALVQGVANEGFVVRGIVRDLPAPRVASATSSAAAKRTEFNLHFLTDTELFGWSKPQARRRPTPHSTVAPEIFFADVKPGEYVVHLEHGVGRYDGLVRLELGGMAREYLQVSYARNDKLYVPVHQADRLSRYVGVGEKTPAVNRLGTADWQLVKERAKRAVAEIADDLLQLYATRELARGHAYSPDGPWQEELAASFPYEETDDQLSAIDAVRQDMESDKPMDRLIAGDVGYGKTEVAVRAAFKAIMDGKQVAMLTPTTVLAQQHFRTLSERLARFPVRVEMLSRFRTPAQQEAILAGLRNGSIDLVVGTHRLLSQDLEFKELGMLIIDEEQRFGVVQKERLKQLRTEIDVLTLSATPIPRTLHMSLSGIRDMSTINTPPKERLPIHTVLAEYDDVLVRQAIQRELARNGQVYVVNDKVRGIQHLADRIRHLAPEATVAVGHGQMPERQLEDVMFRFAQGEYDILVATTIIENGLDIPNANTMIINRADHFGLAQLYQLRGRVGRSAQRGHCYLLYEKHTSLSYDARRRLSAIMESSEELGAGFRIAMRDLEIRGAGDLLGARQHGHIDSVGFDLYTRLLAQAINEARRKKSRFDQALSSQEAGYTANNGEADDERGLGQPAVQSGPDGSALHDAEALQLLDLESPFDVNDPLAPPVLLDLPLDAQIPQTYVEEESLRLQMYRRIAGMTHLESIDEMRKEMLDRFGTDDETGSVPEELENLFYQIKVKIRALRANVQNIGRELDQLVIRSDTLENINRAALEGRLRQAFGQTPGVEYPPDEMPRVARRSVYLPIDEAGKWRQALVRTLEIMAYT
jgi:transcription-repair coupling factor (superfamily II helicase)